MKEKIEIHIWACRDMCQLYNAWKIISNFKLAKLEIFNIETYIFFKTNMSQLQKCKHCIAQKELGLAKFPMRKAETGFKLTVFSSLLKNQTYQTWYSLHSVFSRGPNIEKVFSKSDGCFYTWLMQGIKKHTLDSNPRSRF